MNQSRSDTGQSMEEILASIRRIIAEGEREAQAGTGHSEDTAPAETGSAAVPAAEAAQPAATEPDVLVLTQMVQDDGSVVSLPSELGAAAAEPAAEATPSLLGSEPSSVMEHPAEPPFIAISASIEQAEAFLAPASERIATLAEVVEPGLKDPFAAAAGSAAPVADRHLESSLTTTPTAEERNAVPAEGSKKPEIVSEEALAASTAALSQLAQSVTRMREPVPGQTKTVDDLVREAVEPMLKQWLDANLSRIVERMVREAIDRVVRRVE